MKREMLCLAVAALVVGGCVYEAPLAEPQGRSIDPAVLGRWKATPDDGGGSALVLAFSDEEYLVHYPLEEDGIYFRAYPIELGGIACVQFKAVGTGEGPVDKDEKSLFHVLSYRIVDGELVVGLLNTELVDKGLTSSAALREAFLEHKDAPDLFTDEIKFRKAAQ